MSAATPLQRNRQGRSGFGPLPRRARGGGGISFGAPSPQQRSADAIRLDEEPGDGFPGTWNGLRRLFAGSQAPLMLMQDS